MTHIDPFAPGDSPQHPANFQRPEYAETSEVPADAAPPWIAIVGDPIPDTPEGEKIADARWEEYETLLRQRGTPEQVEIFDAVLTADWPKDMPTLVALRDMPDAQSAGEEGAEVGNTEESGESQEEDLEAKLQAELAALEDTDL